jgi:hypothetical protein
MPPALLLLVALNSGGCGRALAPVTADRDTARGMAAGLAIEPGPGQPAPPDEGGTVTPSPFPSASITDPRPNHLLAPTLPTTFTVHWSPNVPVPGGPVPSRYRYRVFDENGTDFDFVQLLVDPQSMLRFYAPGFAGWTEVDASVTQATLHDLDPSGAHVLVLIAIDDHGHFDSAISFDKNMLYFHVTPALVTDADRGTR